MSLPSEPAFVVKYRSTAVILLATLALSVFAVGCSDTPRATEAVSRTREAVEATPASLTLSLPDNMAPQRVPVAATHSLQVRDRAIIKAKLGGYAPVVNTGSTETLLGADAISGNVLSEGPVRLSPRTRVEGFVRTAGTLIPAADAVVTGGVQANTALGALRKLDLVDQRSIEQRRPDHA